MKNYARKLLSLIVVLMMMMSCAMAGMNDYIAFLQANAPVLEAGKIDFSLTNELELITGQITTDALSDDTIDYMVKSLHWLYALYNQSESSVRDWCVPVLELDNFVVYMADVSYILKKTNSEPDTWLIADSAVENYEEAVVMHYSADAQKVLMASRMRPSGKPTRGIAEDAAGETGYGFRIVEENGQNKLALGYATLKKNGANYTVPSDTFVSASPVYTESGLLVGVSDGGTNVYSCASMLEAYCADTGDGESENEPAEEPTAAPTAAPTAVPTEVPDTEPSAPPAAEPEDEEDDDPKATGMDDDDKTKLIVGAVVVILAAAYFWKKRRNNGNKNNDNNPTPPGSPKNNVQSSVPRYEPQGDPTTPLNDNAAASLNSGISKTVLVSEPEKKRIVVGIRCVGGTMNGAVIRIEREVRIGRDPKRCGIVYPEKERGISGLHCAVAPTADGALTLTDLGSSYGTTANGRKLSANVPCILRAGDQFALADGNNRYEVFTEEI